MPAKIKVSGNEKRNSSTFTVDKLTELANGRDTGKQRHKAQAELIRRGVITEYYKPAK